jgi:hypothetical protein
LRPSSGTSGGNGASCEPKPEESDLPTLEGRGSVALNRPGPAPPAPSAHAQGVYHPRAKRKADSVSERVLVIGVVGCVGSVLCERPRRRPQGLGHEQCGGRRAGRDPEGGVSCQTCPALPSEGSQ